MSKGSKILISLMIMEEKVISFGSLSEIVWLALVLVNDIKISQLFIWKFTMYIEGCISVLCYLQTEDFKNLYSE